MIVRFIGVIVISIHALVKRATELVGQLLQMEYISIHALVKRATSLKTSSLLESFDFNPRPREEGDKSDLEILSEKIISIHALVKRATATNVINFL